MALEPHGNVKVVARDRVLCMRPRLSMDEEFGEIAARNILGGAESLAGKTFATFVDLREWGLAEPKFFVHLNHIYACLREKGLSFEVLVSKSVITRGVLEAQGIFLADLDHRWFERPQEAWDCLRDLGYVEESQLPW